eukprot:s188_g41.t1
MHGSLQNARPQDSAAFPETTESARNFQGGDIESPDVHRMPKKTTLLAELIGAIGKILNMQMNQNEQLPIANHKKLQRLLAVSSVKCKGFMSHGVQSSKLEPVSSPWYVKSPLESLRSSLWQ